MVKTLLSNFDDTPYGCTPIILKCFNVYSYVRMPILLLLYYR